MIEQIRKQREVQNAGKGKGEPAPIRIRVGENGQIHIESDDPAALDLIEELFDEQAPTKRDWKVFQLKYATTWAFGIELTLKDLFKEEMETEKKKGNGMEYDPYFGMVPSGAKATGARKLSKRKPMKIISDRDTQTILVQSGTADQLRTIQDVIAIYDRAPSTEGRAVRKTQIFQVKYGKARLMAEAVKDVYRDLLSDNDKALQENKGGNKKDERPSGPTTTYVFGDRNAEGTGDKKEEQPVKFKGLLSIGFEESTNVLIVSATEGLIANVGQIIEALDEAARPNSSVRVVQIDPRVNPKLLQQRLHSILGPKPAQNAQGKQPNGQQQPGNAANNAAAIQAAQGNGE